MGGMVGLWGANSIVESIQYGSMTIDLSGTNTSTITSVDTSRAIVSFLGVTCDTSTANPVFTNAHVVLTNATTVTGTSYADAARTRTVAFAVIQFVPGVLRSRQAFAILIPASTTSVAATITAVTVGKALVIFGGQYVNAGDDQITAYLTLTNATTVTATNSNTVSGADEIRGTVMEFF